MVDKTEFTGYVETVLAGVSSPIPHCFCLEPRQLNCTEVETIDDNGTGLHLT